MHATPPRTPARLYLRQATAMMHRAVEQGFAGLDLSARPDYRRFLEVHAAAFIPLERWAEHAGAADLLPDWPERKRTAALIADLACLGGSVGGGLQFQLEPSRQSLAGVLYVLEGSRLGARVIVDAIKPAADPARRLATQFLRHGEGQRLWPRFADRLEQLLADDDDRYHAAVAANAAFDLVRQAQHAAAQHRQLEHV